MKKRTNGSLPVLLVVVLIIAGCGLKPPTTLDNDARAYTALVASGRLDSAFALLQVSGSPEVIKAQLQQVADSIRPFALDSAKLIGWNVVEMGDTRGELTYEIHAGERWALLDVGLVRSGGSSHITAFHWQPTSGPLAKLNAFTLAGRTPTHYLFLCLAALSVLACVGGAVLAFVRKVGWLWVLFCLVGVGKFVINWTTGQTGFQPISFQLLGAAFFRPGTVGPWLVSWSVPLGTILLFVRLRSRRTATQPTSTVPAPQATATEPQ